MTVPNVIDNGGAVGGGGGGGGSRKYRVTEPTTANYVEYLNVTSTNGLGGGGTIKNTGAQSLSIKETVTDLFGVTVSLETTVLAGNDFLLSLAINIATARPPYLAYIVDVKHLGGGATTFDLALSVQGAD